MNKLLKRIISLLIIISMVLPNINTMDAYAIESSSVFYDISGVVQGESEKTQEAINDYASNGSTLDWRTAIFVDKFYWNSFHNQVQNDLRNRYDSLGKQELEVKFVDDEGKVSGKGRVDLYMSTATATYIWEVKPQSYAVEPNRSAGIEQLNRYKSTNAKYAIGGNQITGGKTYLYKDLYYDTYVEHVTYTIDYTVHSDGLIIYTFSRSSTKEEKGEEKVKEPVKIQVPSYAYALNDVFSQEEESEGIGKNIMIAVVVATALGARHAIINKNAPNSISTVIVNATTAFLTVAGTSPETVEAAEIEAAYNEFLLALEVYCGDEISQELLIALKSNDTEKIEELLKEIQEESDEYDEAGRKQPPNDPLVVDMGEEGIELCSIDEGVNFDLDNNGFSEKTAWIGTEDGFLAVDRNGNGIIDNGSELFGDQVILSDGNKSTSGFVALEDVDNNQDKIIDNNDEIFENLLIWIDENHNGVSESNELKTLMELNIVSISLEYEEVSFVDSETGTRIENTSSVKIDNTGEIITTKISEFWFPINSTDTTQGDVITVGNISDISLALADDSSGELYELIYLFSETEEIVLKRYYIKQILYFIADATEVDANSRGGNIDARELKVIEEFMGREFVGIGGNDPNESAADILKDIYISIEDKYYNIINMYCGFGAYLKLVYEYEDSDGNTVLNLDFINYMIESKIEKCENVDVLLYDLGVYLRTYDEINSTNYYNGYCDYYSSFSKHYADIVKMTQPEKTEEGTNDSEKIIGLSGNDFIYGMAGNDIIYGSLGNDVLVGGVGNDTLYGEAGSDIYYFEAGWGSDTIANYDTGTGRAEDKILFGEGIKPEDIQLSKSGDHMYIKNTVTGDVIKLYDAYYYSGKYGMVENIEFADGTLWGIEEITEQIRQTGLNGTDGDDSISGVTAEYGYTSNEILRGGAGNDTLYGKAGNDILIGGAGNDVLQGDEGSDTYYFEPGWGNDIIGNYDTSTGRVGDKILFGEGINIEDLEFSRSDVHMYIKNISTGDVIKVYDAYYYGNNKYGMIDNIEFADGTVLGIEDIKAKLQSDGLNGTEGADSISGYAEVYGYAQNETFRGHAGNDTLAGNAGDDKLYGGDGNDTIKGGSGNDYLVGESGNDTLQGDEGSDIYYFEAGWGSDTIANYDTGTGRAEDKILFGETVSSTNVKLSKSGDDMYIKDISTGSVIRIYDAFYYGDNKYGMVENIEFADGTIWGIEEITEQIRQTGLNGTDGDDSILGVDAEYGYTSDEILRGGAGNDTLYGKAGNDILIGGAGNDTLQGDAGSDTYYFEAGWGSDTIGNYDTSAGRVGDKILFGEGISIEDLEFSRRDVHIYIKNIFTGDVIKIFDAYYYGNNKYAMIDNIEFADGTVLGIDGIKSKLQSDGLNGTEGADSISGYAEVYGYSQNETFRGYAGNDTLTGNAGDDKLYGGDGNDTIKGGSGNDVLVGEAGNDTLQGDEGSDIYYFEAGWGSDTIVNYDTGTGRAEDKILFGAGINPEDIQLSKSGNHMYIKNVSTGDVIKVYDAYYYGNNKYGMVENIEFADGTLWGIEEIIEQIRQTGLNGTDGNDSISGVTATYGYTSNEILRGGAGNDTLYGKAGDDILIGGAGNDVLQGDEGSDTYYFEAGWGSDTIGNYDTSTGRTGDKILFGEGISIEDLSISKSGYHMYITNNKTNDTIKIFDQYYYKDNSARLDNIEFIDGTKAIIDCENLLLVIVTVEDDEIE